MLNNFVLPARAWDAVVVRPGVRAERTGAHTAMAGSGAGGDWEDGGSGRRCKAGPVASDSPPQFCSEWPLACRRKVAHLWGARGGPAAPPGAICSARGSGSVGWPARVGSARIPRACSDEPFHFTPRAAGRFVVQIYNVCAILK